MQNKNLIVSKPLKYGDEKINDVKRLVCNFEFEIDNNPSEWNFELRIINNCNNNGINWQIKLINEVIKETQKMFKEMTKRGSTEPIKINFDFLASLLLNPCFGLSFNYKKAEK